MIFDTVFNCDFVGYRLLAWREKHKPVSCETAWIVCLLQVSELNPPFAVTPANNFANSRVVSKPGIDRRTVVFKPTVYRGIVVRIFAVCDAYPEQQVTIGLGIRGAH